VLFSTDLSWLSPLFIFVGVVLFITRQDTTAGRIGRVLIGLGVAGMARLLGDNPDLARYLTLGGALFLLAYGLMALWRMAMAPDAQLAASGGQLAPRGLLGVVSTLAVITLFNPHVYLDTVLLMGSIGARQEGALKWVYVIGAASASLSWFVLLAFAGRRLRRLFEKPRAWRILDGLTGVMMLALAWWVAGSVWAPAGA